MKKLLFSATILIIFIFGCVGTQPKDVTSKADSKFKKDNLPLMSVRGTKCDSFDLSIKDISTCERMDDSKREEKLKCYYSVALAKKDASICHKLPHEIEWDCYECVSVIKKDLSVCNNIPVPEMKHYRDYCYLTFARGMSDPTVCELFDTQKEKDECYVYVVSATGDISVCNKIQRQDGKDLCYKAVATKTESVCVLQTGISCMDHRVTSKEVALVVQNALGYSISEVSVSVQGCGSSNSPSTIEAGEQGTYKIICDHELTGTTYNAQLSVSYKIVNTGKVYTNIGQIRAKIEK